MVTDSDIDFLTYNGTGWEYLRSIHTDTSGNVYIYLIDGQYSIWTANITFTVNRSDSSSATIPDVLYMPSTMIY